MTSHPDAAPPTQEWRDPVPHGGSLLRRGNPRGNPNLAPRCEARTRAAAPAACWRCAGGRGPSGNDGEVGAAEDAEVGGRRAAGRRDGLAALAMTTRRGHPLRRGAGGGHDAGAGHAPSSYEISLGLLQRPLVDGQSGG